MTYNKLKDKNLSTLGYGGMRLPTKEVNGKYTIDEAEAEKLLTHAYKNGINLFDTAFFYHAGESERVIGKILNKFPRDTWYLSNKMPGNFMEIKDGKILLDVAAMGMKNMTVSTPAEVFEYQLNNCGVEYFDFYMLHNVSESTFDLYTDESLGILRYLLEEMENGRIRHLGFSTHGRPETIEKFLDMYDCFEFVMLQINYLDWSLQEAQKKYDIISKHGLPIFAMEPVRGGKLIKPGKEAESILSAARPGDSMAKWAFRFLQSLPSMCVTISGMSTFEQLAENMDIFSTDNPMSDAEKEYLWKAVDTMASFVPCTSCRYCTEACPVKLDIPLLITTYNEASHDFEWYVRDILDTLPDDKKPEACTSCGVCNHHCPQGIDIPETIQKFAALIKEKTS